MSEQLQLKSASLQGVGDAPDQVLSMIGISNLSDEC